MRNFFPIIFKAFFCQYKKRTNELPLKSKNAEYLNAGLSFRLIQTTKLMLLASVKTDP